MHRNDRVKATATALLTAGLVWAAPAHADPDTDFANQLQSFGIHGPRDYNAWIGKISCKRLNDGLDADPFASTHFVSLNLPQGSTTEQAWQFLGIAISTYCPDQMPVLQRVADSAG